jgi:hypothetical protein
MRSTISIGSGVTAGELVFATVEIMLALKSYYKAAGCWATSDTRTCSRSFKADTAMLRRGAVVATFRQIRPGCFGVVSL